MSETRYINTDIRDTDILSDVYTLFGMVPFKVVTVKHSGRILYSFTINFMQLNNNKLNQASFCASKPPSFHIGT